MTNDSTARNSLPVTAPPTEVDAIVVGAGIAGLAAAVALQRAGRRCLVVERRPALPRGGGAILMWSNALNAFATLGLADAVVAIGTTLDRTEFRSWSGELLSSLPIGDLSRKAGAPSLVVYRETLLELLATAVGHEHVRFGTACRAIGERDGEVQVTLDDGAVVRATMLVGADGIDSTVRALLFDEGDARDTDHLAWGGSAPVTQDVLALGVSSVTHGRGARIWIAPCRNGEMAWIALAAKDVLSPEQLAGGRRERVAAVYADAHRPIPELVAATPDARMFEIPIRYRPASDVWGRGRITLVGDAAHACTPDLAQAACQAIEDAAALHHAVASSAGAVASTLRAYEAGRVTRARRVTNLSRIALAQGAERDPLLCWLRDRSTDFFVRTVVRRQIWDLLGYRA